MIEQAGAYTEVIVRTLHSTFIFDADENGVVTERSTDHPDAIKALRACGTQIGPGRWRVDEVYIEEPSYTDD